VLLTQWRRDGPRRVTQVRLSRTNRFDETVPPSSLARAGVARVTDMDAGAEMGFGVGQAEGIEPAHEVP
jgi:hypothetical protein